MVAANPPSTKRMPVTDVYHGVKIVDPYRWLEDRNSPATNKWIKEQNAYSDAVIKPMPQVAILKKQLAKFAHIDNVSTPVEHNGRLFFKKRKANQEQGILYYREGIAGADHVIEDPIPLSKDHSTSADFEDISLDGRYVAYHIRVGGEDESTIHIRDLQTGKNLPDSLPRANYWSFSLKPDMSGYYYAVHTNLVGVRVYYHVMGTPVSEDKEIFGKGYGPEIGLSAQVTEDGRYLILVVAQGWAKTEVYAQDLQSGGDVFPVVTGMDANYTPEYADGSIYVLTDHGASNRHIYKIDPKNPARDQWKEVVKPGADTIENFSLVGGKMFVESLHNVVPRIRVFLPSGSYIRDLRTPGIGDASIPSGTWKGHSAFYDFHSFADPNSIYRLDTSDLSQKSWYQTVIPGLNLKDIVVEQQWATSKDGAKVPMFIVHKKGLKLDGKRPCVITGYGGFDLNELPYFSGVATILAHEGGVFADVTLRGGGEFGEAWHQAGMLAHKQNVFNDLYAATEWLIRHRYTDTHHDSVIGGSNGGLLVGAAITQRPDLYQAAVCEVPLLDMLRYQLFLQGPQWVPEYGSSANPEQFKWLLAYSPYQHVKKGVKYPAVLFVSGDGDTRVAPLHARKMTALMQWATASKRPILLHYEMKAGHSGGQSVTQAIDTNALVLGFLLHEIGVRPGPSEPR